jgi:hypothetical protein
VVWLESVIGLESADADLLSGEAGVDSLGVADAEVEAESLVELVGAVDVAPAPLEASPPEQPARQKTKAPKNNP